MSWTLGGKVQRSALLSRLLEIPAQMTQDALQAAGEAGFKFLEDNTPVDTGLLLDTAGWGQNQSSVWFFVAAVPGGPQMGGEHAYGFYQEWGWHDRGGGWHEGHHMVAQAVEEAQAVFVDFVRGTMLLRPRSAYITSPTPYFTPGGF